MTLPLKKRPPARPKCKGIPIRTIADQVLATRPKKNGNETFGYALRHFLDAFYATSRAERSTLLLEEPPLLDTFLKDGRVGDSYLAALANHLAWQYQVDPPSWASTTNLKRIPEKPWFSLKLPKCRIWLLTESPGAFRERNLFITSDALTRV